MGSSPHGNSRVLVDDEYVWRSVRKPSNMSHRLKHRPEYSFQEQLNFPDVSLSGTTSVKSVVAGIVSHFLQRVYPELFFVLKLRSGNIIQAKVHFLSRHC